MVDQPKSKTFVGLPAKVSELVRKESDRGIILILGSYLEEILGLIISDACVSEEKAKTILSSVSRGFEAKIRLCDALGLIHEDDTDSLNIVRQMRNDAAHFQKCRGFDVLFDSSQCVSNLRKLVGLQKTAMMESSDIEKREAFVFAARILALKLYSRRFMISRPAPAGSMKETTKEILDRMKDPRFKEISSLFDEERCS